MNPSDVNRLNYNCHYIGQNLDYLVREKMKSESFITPLKVTPKYYEDEVTKKMKLLGNRGHYFPEYYEQNRMQYTNDNLPSQYMDNRFPVPYSPPPQQRYIPTPQRTEEITYQPQPYNNSLNKYNEELELKLREQENEKRKYEEYLRLEAEKKANENNYIKYQQQQQQNRGQNEPYDLNYHYRNKY